jgi:hypothetical protein
LPLVTATGMYFAQANYVAHPNLKDHGANPGQALLAA